MAGSRGSALLESWAGWALRRTARNPRDGRRPPADGHAEDEAPTLGTRLLGASTPVARLAVVPARTVVLLREPGRPVVVRRPGELLLPRLLVPGPVAATALPVSTAPVHLDLTVTELVALDGHGIDPVTLRLVLQLDDRDGYAAVIDQLRTHGDRLETVLLGQVQHEGAAAVRGSVAANRYADLQRRGLTQVIGDGWLPRGFAGGLLLLRGCTVLDRPPGARAAAEPTGPVPVPAGDADPATGPLGAGS